MNETTPYDPGSPTTFETIPRRGSSRGEARRRSRNKAATSEPFRGLRMVLHECDRRAAVVRSLSSLRWIAQRGAEVLLFDGRRTRTSADGSLEAASKLFLFVTAVRAGSFPRMIDAAAAPLAVDRLAPQWIFALSADLAVDRFQVQALLAELNELPEGSLLTPAVVGPDGKPCAGCGGAWLARGSDVIRRPLEQLIARPSRSGAVRALQPFRVG